jgi:murein DD-endopeptidase MepM/ murein hydrolase activator NlpD
VDFRLNADKTVRLVRHEVGWESQIVVTPTTFDTVWAAGVIEAGKTLSEAIVMDEQSRLLPQERYRLVYELASIYEFKLDFTREIQPGDHYRVVYEREVRPDGTARKSQVLAAEIVTRGVAYPAYWFEGNDEIRGFFDAEARPLSAGFSKYPVEFRRITSSYNPRRYHPVLGVYRAHNGTDFGGSTGTPVLATADGTVSFAGTSGGYGRMVEIKHFGGYTTRYAHLSAFGGGVRVGARVKQKQVIGKIGATGLATAPHLHYELRKNGRAVNAMKEKLPEAPQLPGKIREQYMALVPERSSLLERVQQPAGQFADTERAPAGTTRAADET